jgi:hypothetical protein
VPVAVILAVTVPFEETCTFISDRRKTDKARREVRVNPFTSQTFLDGVEGPRCVRFVTSTCRKGLLEVWTWEHC